MVSSSDGSIRGLVYRAKSEGRHPQETVLLRAAPQGGEEETHAGWCDHRPCLRLRRHAGARQHVEGSGGGWNRAAGLLAGPCRAHVRGLGPGACLDAHDARAVESCRSSDHPRPDRASRARASALPRCQVDVQAISAAHRVRRRPPRAVLRDLQWSGRLGGLDNNLWALRRRLGKQLCVRLCRSCLRASRT